MTDRQMRERHIGLVLTVQIDLLAADQGGRTRQIQSGYRPLCLIRNSIGNEVTIGLCEVEMHGELPSGRSGEGRLLFDGRVSDLVMSLLSVGSHFSLAEGTHRIGYATVLAIG